MPDLQAQLEPHEDYVELPVHAYSVWWRDEAGVKWSGRMPRTEIDTVVSHLNASYYPVTFWRSPLYEWNRLLAAPAGD